MEARALEPVVVQETRYKLPPARRIRTQPALQRLGSVKGRAGDDAERAARTCTADVEPEASTSLKGYKRVVISPESYGDYKENVRLYQEIFKTR